MGAWGLRAQLQSPAWPRITHVRFHIWSRAGHPLPPLTCPPSGGQVWAHVLASLFLGVTALRGRGGPRTSGPGCLLLRGDWGLNGCIRSFFQLPDLAAILGRKCLLIEELENLTEISPKVKTVGGLWFPGRPGLSRLSPVGCLETSGLIVGFLTHNKTMKCF